MPFVALQLYEDEGNMGAFRKENLQIFLLCNLGAWVITIVAFFNSIDLSYVNTFFDFTTGSEYTCSRFQDASDDHGKFLFAFKKKVSYTKSIHGEIKTWVSDNIVRWRIEGEKWFEIDLIPKEMLPSEELLSEGGAQRRKRSSVSMREVIGLVTVSNSDKVHPLNSSKRDDTEQQQTGLLKSLEGRKRSSATTFQKKKDLRHVAEKIYAARKNNYKRNFNVVKNYIRDNAELFAPLLERCPRFDVVLPFLLEDRFGFRVGRVKSTTKMADWSNEDCRIVGMSFATLLRQRSTGAAALDDWRRQYTQLEMLFTEVEGFEGFMLVLAKNFARDR